MPLKNILNIASSWGQSDEFSHQENKKTKILNISALIGSLIAFLFFIMFFLVRKIIGDNAKILISIALLSFFCFSIPLLLNKLNRTFFAKLYFLTVFNLCVLSWALTAGPETGVLSAFVIPIGLTLILFEHTYKRTILFGHIFPIFLYFTSIFFSEKFNIGFIPHEYNRFVNYYLSFNVMIYISIVIGYFYFINYKSEQSILKLYREIDSIFQNMTQGVLTFGKSFEIDDKYSKYSEKLFETNVISKRNYLDLLFKNSDIADSQRDEIKNVVNSSLGEEPFTFESNYHLLPNEIQFINGEKKTLEINWNYILDSKDTIEKIIIVIRDVTEIKKLQIESEKNQEKLKMINELLKINKDQFQTFCNNLDKHMSEIKKYQTTRDLDSNGLNSIFRNLHTIKGDARTLGLSLIIEKTHESEQICHDVKEGKISYDFSQMENNLKLIEDNVKKYKSVVDETIMGFSTNNRSTLEIENIVRDFIDENNNLDNESFLSKIIAIKNKESWKPLGMLLEDEIASLASLAKSVDKPAPIVEITDSEILFQKRLKSFFKDIFVHLFRNSIDHGIEPSNIRREIGKDLRGKIQINSVLYKNQIEIHYQDDGRGLNLELLKKKGIERKILTEESSSVDIAEIIFHSGVSTSEKITDISGRGVGMDAVKSFIIQNGGDIKINITDNKQESGFIKFKFVITLPVNFARLSSV